jgi:hypothetical protein
MVYYTVILMSEEASISPDPIESDTDSMQQLRSTFETAFPVLSKEADRFPKGFQYVVEGPEKEVRTPEEYEEIKGQQVDSEGAARMAEGDPLYVTRTLGNLNVLSLTESSVAINYTPDTKDQLPFDVVFDRTKKKVTLSGTTSSKAATLLGGLLGKVNEAGTGFERDEASFHLGLTTRNLAYFNRDGTLRESPATGK